MFYPTVWRISKVITQHLGSKYIQLPLTVDQVKEKVDNFYHLLSVPQCIWAIDCTNIDIKAPSSNSTDYMNQKSHFSLNAHTCCDSQYNTASLMLLSSGQGVCMMHAYLQTHSSVMLEKNTPLSKMYSRR